jgi:hypothetical protein
VPIMDAFRRLQTTRPSEIVYKQYVLITICSRCCTSRSILALVDIGAHVDESKSTRDGWRARSMGVNGG